MTRLRLSLNVSARRLLPVDGEEEISIFTAPAVQTPAANEERWSAVAPLNAPVPVELEIFPTVERALGLSINGGSNELVTVRETETAFVVESRRYGHGVGMSQRGAQCMAGTYRWTYDQILRFYYPGMAVKVYASSFSLPAPVSAAFLATPGPAATPTPRPTAAPLSSTPAPGEYLVAVTNIGVNSYLNLRAESNTQSAVLRQLYYGQQLIVTQEAGDWLRVRMDDWTGYVMAQYVTRVEPDQKASRRPAAAP